MALDEVVQLVVHDLLDQLGIGPVHRHLNATHDERVVYVLGRVLETQNAVPPGDLGIRDQILNQLVDRLGLIEERFFDDRAELFDVLGGKGEKDDRDRGPDHQDHTLDVEIQADVAACEKRPDDEHPGAEKAK